MARALTAKQQAFCEAYVSVLDATKAATMAGYGKGAHVRGHDMLKDERIQAEIARLREIRDEEFGMKAADVLRELVGVAMTDIGDLLTWGPKPALDEHGNPILMPDGSAVTVPEIVPVHSSQLTPLQRRAIKSVSMSKDGVFKFELHDRMKSMEMLGRHFGIFEKDNEQAGKAAAGTIAALVAHCQGKPLTPATADEG
ncbi:terminase small subunit [Paracoccus sp. SY]|uniref:terminase small subunit n=1 Tax=Paracoccus sp. SY TaxID=1330255 RepID=UPI000CD1A78B|nr:terminase small subunit [Paracoccus sp. SY]